jgi:spore germination protein GerM
MSRNIFITIILVVFVIFVFSSDRGSRNQNELMDVKIYFYNESLDQGPGGSQCSEKGIVPVTRSIPQSLDRVEKSIELLISGSITEEDKKAGLSTEFPLEGLELKKVKVEDEVAILEFSDRLSRTSGGSCRVSILRAQIEATAKQFRSVKEVKILPEEIFQP